MKQSALLILWALEHFDQAFSETDAWKRLPYPKDAEKRLMEYKGDILVRQAETEDESGRKSKCDEALEAYRALLKFFISVGKYVERTI